MVVAGRACLHVRPIALAAGDGEPVLPRRQVPVRGRDHRVDVRDVGRLSGRKRWAAGSGPSLRLNPMMPIIEAFRAVLAVRAVRRSGRLRHRGGRCPSVAAARAAGRVPPSGVHVRGEHLSERPQLIVFDGVWKKFRRGEHHDSLRDLIPATGRSRCSGVRDPTEDLQEQEFWAVHDVSFEVRPGRGARHHRPERRRQVDDSEAAHAHPEADARALRGPRSGRARSSRWPPASIPI